MKNLKKTDFVLLPGNYARVVEIAPADTLRVFRYRYLLPWNWVRLVAYFKGKKLERELINKLSDEIREEVDVATLNYLKLNVGDYEKAKEK